MVEGEGIGHYYELIEPENGAKKYLKITKITHAPSGTTWKYETYGSLKDMKKGKDKIDSGALVPVSG